MRLTAGTRVGPYEVVALLGTGGMAEVYRARDTRLGRDVALKIVSEALGHDSELLARLEREARLAGSLNHPNVVAVHDIGIHEGSPFFVTELLQGETLRERLTRGPVPLAMALEWARQMAHGLDAAHARGVIHRDIKPENVFLTRDGNVKLLDFGIAKLTEVAREAEVRNIMEETVPSSGMKTKTGTGIVLGTPGYMSPEQVRGDEVDARTDFFSLGAVIYELLSSTRAFLGSSMVDSGYAILHSEPRPLPADTPAQVAQVVRRCLEKDPARRFQSARDLAFNLDLLRSPTESVTVASPPAHRWPRWWWLVVPLATIGLLAVTVATRNQGSGRVVSVRWFPFREGYVSAARFAPDARTVIFSASWSGEPERIYSTTTDAPDYHSLGLDDARIEAISSAGELALLLRPRHGVGTLARVPGVGGVPREVAADVSSADWGPDGLKMAIVRRAAGAFRLEYPIGTLLYESSRRLEKLRISPDGTRVAFVEYDAPGTDARGSIVVIESGQPKRVVVPDWLILTGLAWAPSGNELWFGGDRTVEDQTALWTVSLRGETRLLHRGMGQPAPEDISRDGRALVRDQQFTNDVAVMGVGQKRLAIHLGSFDWPIVGALSADGTAMLIGEIGYAAAAFSSRTGAADIWTFLQRTDGSAPVRLGPGMPLSLSRDGKRALVVDYQRPGRIWLLPTGTGTSRSIDFPRLDFASGWYWGAFLPDAKRAVVGARQAEGLRGYLLELESGTARPVTPPLVCCSAQLSPDGHALAGLPESGGWTSYPLDGSSPRPLPGIGAAESVVGWTPGGILVTAEPYTELLGANPSVRVFQVDLGNGSRRPFVTLELGDTPGLHWLNSLLVSADERTAAYAYAGEKSRLYLFDFRGRASGSQR